jgi:hypothetical protein
MPLPPECEKLYQEWMAEKEAAAKASEISKNEKEPPSLRFAFTFGFVVRDEKLT